MKNILKISSLVITSALALSACAPAERVAESSPVLLGDVNNVRMYAVDVTTIASENSAPELVEQFETLMNSETSGVEGTPAQRVLATEGLEQFFEDYAQVTEYSTDFERNLFACHVDNSADDVETCIQDLYSAMYDN